MPLKRAIFCWIYTLYIQEKIESFYMANTYYKLMSQKISAEFTDKLIGGLQNDMKNSAAQQRNSLYEMMQKNPGMTQRSNDTDINTLLKYYLIMQILHLMKRKPQRFGK